MAVIAIRKPGPVPKIADLDLDDSTARKVNNDFWEACSQLNCTDCCAIARRLDFHFITILRWKYKQRLPTYEIRRTIIQWVEDGKPMLPEEKCIPGPSMF